MDGLCKYCKTVSGFRRGIQKTRGCHIAGEQKHLAIRTLSLDLNCEIDAAHLWHDDVSNEKVRSFLMSRFQCFQWVHERSGIKLR